VQTPAPIQSDSEDVTTALETAAIFAARNDVSEAARWLRRAAEWASQHGDHARASGFVRAANELSVENLPSSLLKPELEPPTERRVPTPPPLRPSVRPPPPSERSRNSSSDDSQPMLLVRPASTPAMPAVKPSSRPSAAPAPRTATVPTRPPPARAPSMRPPVTALAQSAAPLAANRDHHEESSVRFSTHHAHEPFPLHGARAAVTPSEGSSRYYVLQVLDAGEPLPKGALEAYVVLVDPKSQPSR
jgi:hypothetical protein